MSAPTEVFNPHRTPVEKLVRMTVARDDLLVKILESLCLGPEDQHSPHWLLTGQRGLGKTHLLRVLFHKVATDERTAERWVILHQREEEYWRVHSMATFLRNLVAQLSRECEIHWPDSHATRRLASDAKDLSDQPSGEDMFIGARAALDRFHRSTGKRIAIGAENLDSLFGQFKDARTEGGMLRDFLQHCVHVSLIGTSITNHLGTDLGDEENPLFQFFRVVSLPRLTFEEQLQQLRRIAEVDDDQTSRQRVQLFLSRRRQSLRVIHHLSGGNPRLGVILYGILAGPEILVETIELLHNLLDLNTPYFQDRMKDLAPQQRPVAAAFCEAETTLTGADVARIAGIDRNVVYSLLTRLERAGFIEPVEPGDSRQRRKRRYQVAEDLFRMWWQYRFDDETQVRRVIHFLAIIYENAELQDLESELNRIATAKGPRVYTPESVEQCLRYISAAIDFQKTTDYQNLFTRLEPRLDDTAEEKDREALIKSIRQFLSRLEATSEDYIGLDTLPKNEEELGEAERRLARAIELDQDNFKAWNNLGVVRKNQGNYSGAESALEKAVEIDPQNHTSWHTLGIVRLSQDNYSGAESALEKVVEIDPRRTFSWFVLGAVRGFQGNFSGAESALEKVVEIAPSDHVPWLMLAMFRGVQGNNSGAEIALKKAVEINPQEHMPWHFLGRARLNQGNLSGAADACTIAVELDPRDNESWHNLGIAKQELGDHKGAQSAFEKAIETDPRSTDAWIGLVKTKLALSDHDGLRDVVSRIRKLKPPSLEVHSALFTLTSLGVLDLEEEIFGFAGMIDELEGTEQQWSEFLARVAVAMLSSLDIKNDKALERRLELHDHFVSLDEETYPLKDLSYVFEYFLAMLRPSAVDGGEKMTPKQRARRILTSVPREQRRAIRKLVRFAEERRAK